MFSFSISQLYLPFWQLFRQFPDRLTSISALFYTVKIQNQKKCSQPSGYIQTMTYLCDYNKKERRKIYWRKFRFVFRNFGVCCAVLAFLGKILIFESLKLF
jgi:hypothetical protein